MCVFTAVFQPDYMKYTYKIKLSHLNWSNEMLNTPNF